MPSHPERPARGPCGPTPAGGLPVLFLLLATGLAAGVSSPVQLAGAAASVTLQDQDTIPRYQLPGVTVTSRRATLSAGGASVVQAPLDSMMLAPSISLGEVLRELPFVQIRTNSRGEEQPSLRGAGSRQVAIVLDGIPLTLGWDHRTDLSLVPLQGASQLDLHRGLPSLLFGPNVLGGVIEVSFSQPLDATGNTAGLADSRGIGASSRISSSGEWRLDAQGSTVLRTEGLSWQLRGGAGTRRSDGFTLPAGAADSPDLIDGFLVGEGELRLNSDLERIQGFGSLRVQGEDGGWGTLGFTGHDTRRGVPPEAHTTSPRLWREPARDALLLTAGGGQTFETRFGTTEFSAVAGLRSGSTEREVFEGPDYATTTDRQWEDGRTGTLRLTARTTTDRGLSIRGALTGADVLHTEGAPGEPGERYRQRLWSAGAEIETPVDRGPGGRTNLAGGIVIEGADTPDAGPWDPSPGIGTWGARAGLSTLLVSSGRATGNLSISRRARFPSLRERYSGALGRFLPNPDLRPETQLAAEGGVTVSLGRSELQGVLFYQRTRDGITRISVESDGDRLLQRVNRDRVTAVGAELLATLETGPASIEADLTLQSTTVTAGQGPETPEYEPGWRGSLGARTTPGRLAGGGSSLPDLLASVGIRGSLSLEGVQSCLDPATGALEELPVVHIANLGFDLPIRLGTAGDRGLVVGAAVDNLTDTLSYDQCGLPRPGRTFHLSLRLR